MYKIYCDMDGVLTDFVGQFASLGQGDVWDYEKKVGTENMWELVKSAGFKFWSDMPWTQDGSQLWKKIMHKDVTILTTPARFALSINGKIAWLRKELGVDSSRVLFSANKEKYACPNSILIDDFKKNIDAWEKKGGIGILHKSAPQTISELNSFVPLI
jgi:hypothetical protein